MLEEQAPVPSRANVTTEIVLFPLRNAAVVDKNTFFVVQIEVFQPTAAMQLREEIPRTLIDAGPEGPTIRMRSCAPVFDLSALFSAPGYSIGDFVVSISELAQTVLRTSQRAVSGKLMGAIGSKADETTARRSVGYACGLVYRFLLLGSDGFPGATNKDGFLQMQIPALGCEFSIASRGTPYSLAE